MAEQKEARAPGQAEIDSLFTDAVFRELKERGNAALLFFTAEQSLAWANQAARRLFGSKLEALASRLATGAPISSPAPRLKHMLIERGERATPLSFLTKQASLSDGREVVVAAVLGAVAIEPGQELAPQSDRGEQAAAAPDQVEEFEAPTAAAQPEVLTAHEVRAGFLRTHRNPTVRFLWQTDEAGRLTSVTPPLGEIVGSTANIVGREFAEVVHTLKLDPGGRLLIAMRVPETWSGIEVAWPIAGAAATVPVDLGGFPVFDAGRVFRGFRGFGAIHLDRIRDAEPLAGPPEPRGADAAEAQQGEDKAEAPPASTAHELPVAEPPAAAMMAAPNVVPLRPFATLATSFGFRPPGAELPAPAAAPPSEASAAPLPSQSLSASEHQAFEEIGRRLTGEEAPNPEAEAAAAVGDPATTIIDRLPLGVLISRDESLVYVNRMLLELTGHASAEHLQKAGGLAGLFERRRTTENDAGTTCIRTRQRELVPVESKLQAISWEGQPASLLTVRRASDGANFAEARSLEIELQQRDAELRDLRAILDTATDGVAIVDADGRILSLNRSAEALFGYQQNEVAGEPFATLIAAESRRLLEDYFTQVKSPDADSGQEREVYATSRHGDTIPLALALGGIGGDDHPVKFCAVLRNMSAWKRTEHEAHEAREEAERASAIKSDFLARVSHEIRTPLNAIIGFAEVIMDERLGPIGTERYKDYLRDIHRSGTHVMSLVNDLLDLSKIEAGKMVLDIKSVDANAIISECVALMQPQANRERVIMRLALAPRLVQIAADERSVRQIVLNLLSNAVKYNEPGGQVIVSTAIIDTGHVAIRVKDTGIGMSEAELALALEPFRQVATARPVSGTGLGLPLTKALVEANRANFTIRSRKKEGTLVEVSFPPARILAASA